MALIMLQQAPPALVRELEAIEEQLASAYRKHDCEAWGALLGDEWAVTHITGQVIAKKEALEMCRTAPEVLARYEDLSVRSYGTMAIVTGVNNASLAKDPRQITKLRFTDVFLRRNGRWVVVMSHATAIPGK
jgi:ketosteroid isomerase-like protein